MSNATKTTEQYHEQFQQAQTDAERYSLAANFKTYYAQLSDADKAESDKVRDRYFAVTLQQIEAMEPMLQRAEELLERVNIRKATTHTTESAARR